MFEARSSHQPSPVLTRTPSVASTVAPSPDKPVADFVDDRELAHLVDLEAQFRGRDRDRHVVHDFGQRSADCDTASISRTAA